jgi:hypothetical protein
VAFDRAADELRAALGWAAGQARLRGVAYRLAVRLAELSFARGLPGESQDRYEQAAELADADPDAAAALRGAAGAAEFRYQGDDALRLRRAAAGRALQAGDRAGAAADLARAAELVTRLPGLWDTPPAVTAADQLIAEARALGPDSPAAEARMLAAEGFRCPETDPAVASLAERALVSARQAGDVLAESSALDLMTSIQLVRGEVSAAAASSWRRTELLAPLRPRADMGFEFPDALMMAEECALAAGELPKARALAERLADLPFHHEGGHHAACRLIVVAALTGDWDEALLRAGRFREEWELAGRPHGASWARASAASVARGLYTAATIHGLRGNQAERDAWLEVADALAVTGKPWRGRRFGQFLDAWLLLHQGRAEEAGQVLDAAPEPDGLAWQNGMWQPWCAALWAEAAVLAGRGDAAARIAAAQEMTRDNRAASAIVGRAAALPGDRAGLTRAAAALQAAGFRYQWARTLVFLGGEDRERGESVLAGLGAAAMAWPPAG